jgi:hypothetical protein
VGKSEIKKTLERLRRRWKKYWNIVLKGTGWVNVE